MDDNPVHVRHCVPTDSERVAALLGQLGYPTQVREVESRLKALNLFGQAIVIVAECEAKVVAVATGHVVPAIHASEPVAWLTALVVDDAYRGKGIGAQLTARVEEWARSRGAGRIMVTSGLQRERAHRFYEELGYTRTGLRLAKELVSPRPH